MLSADAYQLLDFGQGRKLERFGSVVLDRPSPAADGLRQANPALWSQAMARYERQSGELGQWKASAALPESWEIPLGALRVQLRPTPFGHVGLFPEQAASWEWIAQHLRGVNLRFSKSDRERQTGGLPHEPPCRLLNLFAYTGCATLVAAAAGAEVVHVDAAAGNVAWARRNAELTGLAAAPIRWIVEDSFKFARRELKRGNRYDAVILDPPTYGHGPKGEPWKLAEQLLPLLEVCGQLTEGQRTFILLSCHAPGIGPAELSAYLADGIFGHCSAGGSSHELMLQTPDGRQLPSGIVACWP